MKNVKCFFYLKYPSVEGYIWERDNWEKVAKYERFDINKIEDFWSWWIGNISYIKNEQILDICLVGDSCKNIFATNSVLFAGSSEWKNKDIREFMETYYPSVACCFYLEENVEKCFKINKSKFTKKNLEKTNNIYLSSGEMNKLDGKSINLEDNDEGILYQYFREKTLENQTRLDRK